MHSPFPIFCFIINLFASHAVKLCSTNFYKDPFFLMFFCTLPVHHSFPLCSSDSRALYIPDITCRHHSRHDMTSSFIIMIGGKIYTVNKCDTTAEIQSNKGSE